MLYKQASVTCFLIGFALVFAHVTNFAHVTKSVGDSQSAEEKVRVPVINLAPWFDAPVSSLEDNETFSLAVLTKDQQDIVHQIRRACREVGFFQITGVIGGSNPNGDDDDAVMQRTWKASKDFFDLPLEERLEHAPLDRTEYPYGYERSEQLVRGRLLDETDGGMECDNGNHEEEELCGSSSSETVAADLKETFTLGPPDDNGSGMPPRRWIHKSLPQDFQTSLEVYYERMEDLALTLLQIFAIALEESPDFFRDKMDHHMSALRLVHYYPLEEHAHEHRKASKDETGAPIPQEQQRRLVRAGAHTDYGALTILAAQEEGLEVLLRDATVLTNGDDSTIDTKEQQTQRWYPVPLVPGAFVVNLGDLMQRWTNGEWISTMHRVVMPSTEAQERRYSMAYFVNINGDTPIEPLQCCSNKAGDDGTIYENGRVITAREHLMAKHLASMGISIDMDINDADDKADNRSGNTNKEICNTSA